MANVTPLDDEQLQKIYTWVDQIPLSRPKRNITRDFSDSLLFAEVVHHYFPKMVELHNYSSASSVRQKLYNWSTLNAKVLKRLKFQISKEEMEDVVNCVPGVVEVLLMRLQSKMAAYRQKRAVARSKAAAAQPAGSAHEPVPGGASTGGSFGGGPGGGVHIDGSARGPGGGLGGGGGGGGFSSHAGAAHAEMAASVADKDATIQELSETVEFLELKVAKLEQLLRLKDSRIHTLTARLQSQQLAPGS